MGAASSSEVVAEKLREMGEGSVYATVAKAAVQHNITGRFLLETPTEQLEDLLRSRCSALETVQKKRVMYEIDRLRQQAAGQSPQRSESEEDAPSEDASSLSGEITPAPKQGGLLSRFFGERSLDGPRVEDLAAASCRPPTPEADEWDSSDDECASEKSFEDERTGERWRTSGSRFIGRHVSLMVWDPRGEERNRRQGVVVSYCADVDQTCGCSKLWRARVEDCDECVELDEKEVREATDAWERMMQWRRSDRRPRQRDTASVRREQAAARREQGLADDPEADAAAQAAVRAAQLQLAIPQADGAPRKRGRPPKASTLAARQTPKQIPASPKSARRKATISAAAAAQMLPPTTTRSRAASDADLSPSQRHRGTPRSGPEDISPEAQAARREERKRRRAESEVEAQRKRKDLSQKKRAEVDRTMAGLDVVTLLSPDCLSGLRAQGLTRRDRRRAAAREARAREELARAPPPPPPTPNSTPRNRPRRELAGRRSCAGCNQAPCARSAAGCFRGVGQANGKYVVRGLDHERYPTAELAARRRDMLLAAGACRSFDEPLNFERSDAKQLKFERDFAAKERKESRKRARSHDDDSAPPAPSPRSAIPAASPRPRRGEHIEAPPGSHNVGTLVRHDGRSWWIADDSETIAGIADQHGLDPDKVLAANLHCATFVRSKLHLNSKLRHHTAVLLPGC